MRAVWSSEGGVEVGGRKFAPRPGASKGELAPLALELELRDEAHRWLASAGACVRAGRATYRDAAGNVYDLVRESALAQAALTQAAIKVLGCLFEPGLADALGDDAADFAREAVVAMGAVLDGR